MAAVNAINTNTINAISLSNYGYYPGIINDFKKAFKVCDFIMTPTTPTSAFTFGAKTKDPLKMYLEDYFLEIEKEYEEIEELLS